ncbi:IclR family transcriptional regulator [Frankia sp. AiPa1]|uniref:IclR family transcriptional regulator n=1 Tax=Frankia sp. AiPa1 TaxID=573492 RepID=UPI00202B69B4|nr:helix-turn-helix domain-containing protein [Frankia sp. AiPa1]MCL9760014.1 helix-turn-helix domain-containing protein [Frankia sp. AiPa1]
MAGSDGLAPTRGRGVLEGAFGILDALSWYHSTGLSELARTTGLPKSTVHRLVEQLTAVGAVDRDGAGGYRIGAGLRRITAPDRSLHRLARMAREPVAALSAATGAAVAVVVLRDDQVVAATSAAAERGLDLGDSPTSRRLDTAGGQLLLAHRSDLADRSDLVDRSDPAGPPSMSPRQWQRALAEIREHHVAYDRQDLVTGVCCVSVPIRSLDGTVLAALTAMVLAPRLAPDLVDRLRHTATRLGTRLPGPPPPGPSTSVWCE